MLEAFADDSFLTLALWERVGLVCINLVLLAGLSAAACWVMRRVRLVPGLLVMVLIYWVFLWVAPQIYYIYYIAIFEGLPWQLVIGAPLGAARFLRLISFLADGSLSALAQGIGFWMVVSAGWVCACRRGGVEG